MQLDIEHLRAAYAGGTAVPRALLRGLRDRAAALNDEYRVFIALLDDDALEPYFARLEASSPQQLPLYGVPFAIKDNIDLAGVPTTAGCPAFAYQPERSAAVVERLIELGAVPLGKTNLDQFATGLNGTRSPYGECRNSVLPEYVSGGSSSGSAVAVALGLASFALGTDTAGSGRVPAALNGLVGLKPTLGLLSSRGVVPACRSLDTISLFCGRAGDASRLLALLAAEDRDDPYSRRNELWNGTAGFAAPAPFRFGVPRPQDQVWLDCREGPALFERAVARLAALGGTPIELPFRAFLDAARLTYEGPWVAERYTAVGDFVRTHPGEVNPVVARIVMEAGDWKAHQFFAAEAQRRALKQACDQALAGLDFALMPTIPRPYTREEMRAEPVARNSELGIYTNFVNLLDYAAVAVPAGHMASGLPWGVTLFGRAFTDQYLLGMAHAFAGHAVPAGIPGAAGDTVSLVVCGAHLEGQPLNGQLHERGARLLRRCHTAPRYRLYALPGGPPARPGLVRMAAGGVAIEVEEWRLPFAEVGSFLAGIASPLGLGRVELDDGSWATGFICEGHGIDGARDITDLGGWRAYLAERRGASA